MTRRRLPLCANPDLMTKLAAAHGRSERYPELCEDGATRRVEITVSDLGPSTWTALRADVCLWHSLVVVGQFNGRLIRVLDTALVST
ncbi:hypothetical protein [Actinoplanes palleronii]|uniref:Uncharacterized protein n=1 Tax=Actinoplanes palleronii TaxID=113570 RepID=A0ABQ4B3X6_9ACTN|nr:hypothetical protein [Actinoplanes palleronii]GIE65369.1 hypothetical protein Apa02nite_014770 [Actinoplanes palleronii]